MKQIKKYYNKLADLLLKYKIVDLRSEYSSSILKVFSGGSVAFIIGFLAMPIISRIYPPEEFGKYQLMFSIVTSFAVISTFRYEMAIVLEDTKEDRDKLITLCLILLLFTTSIFTLIFFFFGEQLLTVLNAKELTPYIGFMSFMFLGYGLYELSRYSFISDKKFSALAINNITYQGTTAGLQVTGGYLSPNFFTLFASLIVGYFAAFGLAFYKLKFKIKINLQEAKHLLKKHKKFFFFDMPSSLLVNLTIKFPLVIITKYHGIVNAGYYSMALLLLDTPQSILSSSISQVYYKTSFDIYVKNKKLLLEFYINTIKKLGIISIIITVIIFVLSDFIVNFFLGENWKEVAWIMKIFVLGSFFKFINMPIYQTLNIIDKQQITFYIVVSYFLYSLIAIYYFRFELESMIISIVLTIALYHLSYIFLIYIKLKGLK